MNAGIDDQMFSMLFTETIDQGLQFFSQATSCKVVVPFGVQRQQMQLQR
jgi:hypothetical protein